MTYCLSLLCREGLVFISDSRTSAGVDNITVHPKMRLFTRENERVICLLTSGNLSLSQTVIALIEQDLEIGHADNDHPHLLNRATMFETARYVGQKVREADRLDRDALQRAGFSFNVHFLIGGQIIGQAPEIHLVYPQGNTLRAIETSPFLQIGEYKYGKPVLDRGFTFGTRLADAVKFGIISMEGTMKSNVSVGPPLDIFAYETNSLRVTFRHRLEEDDPYLHQIRRKWSEGIAKLVEAMPGMELDGTGEPLP